MPKSLAALATLVPPPASNACTDPIGGSSTGMRMGLPSSSDLIFTSVTSFKIRGFHPGLYRGAVATQARLGIRSANKIIPIPSI